MSHICYACTASTNPAFFWSHALDQSAVAPCTDGCTALLTGTGIGHDYGHHIPHIVSDGGNGHGNGHDNDDCVPAPAPFVLLALAAVVIAKRVR